MTSRNRTGPSERALLFSGLICLITGIIIIVAARLHTPTPGVVIDAVVAVVAVIAGLTLTTAGILALFSRPVWIEGMVGRSRQHK